MSSIIINNAWTIEIVGTLIGATAAFLLAYKFDINKRRKRYILQLNSVKTEIQINSISIKQIREGCEKGFTIDRLSISATESLILNPDFFRFASQGFVVKMHAYKKSVFIANQMIDFCFNNWKQWLSDPSLKETNLKALEEKFKSVEILSAKIDCLFSSPKA